MQTGLVACEFSQREDDRLQTRLHGRRVALYLGKCRSACPKILISICTIQTTNLFECEKSSEEEFGQKT